MPKTATQQNKQYRELKKLSQAVIPAATVRPIAKTSAQRNKEYRERKKLSQADTPTTTVRSKAKTASQRNKEYRERKKLIQANALAVTERSNAKTPAQRSKEYRERIKLSQADVAVTTLRSKAKTASQRNKEYRERKKLREADASATNVVSNAKTASQRNREYRERKKLLGQTDELVNNAQRCSEYRHRLQLKQLAQISANKQSNATTQQDLIQVNTDVHNLDMPFHQSQTETSSDITNDVTINEPHSTRDQILKYSNYEQHCRGHIDFFNSFKNNCFGHSCAVCDRLWWQQDLKPSSLSHDNILQIIVPNYITGSTIQICSTCKAALDKQKIPIFSTYNGFSYPTIPSHLPALDFVSQRFISPRIPFMQIRRLRHVHGQSGIYGQIINVPVSVNTMVKQLPRNVDDDNCIYVNIKKQFIRKTSDIHGLIDKQKIKEWLTYLVETPLYIHHNITIDHTFFNNGNIGCAVNIDEISEHVPLEDNLTAQQQTLIWNEDEMLQMAPSEINTSLLFDDYAEEFSFPTIYLGQFRKYRKKLHVTSIMQATSELRRTDRRGADPQHILYVATKIMTERIKDRVSLASKHIGINSNITKEQIQSENYINNCIETNLAFLRCIPNSAWYWAGCKKDLFAIMRQKGAPTAFMTLSANETEWKDLLKLLYKLKNNGANISDELLTEMSYIQKAALVNEDAITCAIYFNKLINCLLHILQAKKRSPFGPYRVLEYFKRMEFQHQGSPLAHILLWLDNVPADLLTNNADVIGMIDQLVSVSASEASGNIKLQTHKHTYACYKTNLPRKKTNCKFGAPFMPSRQTVTLLPMTDTDDDYSEDDFNKYVRHYKQIQNNLENVDYADFNHFYTHNNIESDLHYNNILRAGINQPMLFYKRTPSEKWHNPFNPFVFHHLQSNMNFQFIQDEYDCAAYVVEYVNKTNRGISNLQRRIIEVMDENPEFDIIEMTRQISVDVLHSVEMSVQEAAWYLLREPMAKSSIATVYIPTIYPIERQRIRKSIRELKEMDEDCTDIWKENWFDKYEKRPENLSDVTLAQFVSKYFKNNKGEYAERSEPRVIKYRSYDMIENFNDYRREMVLLHIPFRSEEDDVLAENNFVQLYEDNKTLILQRRKEFESNLDIAKTLDICRQLYTEVEDDEEELGNDNIVYT